MRTAAASHKNARTAGMQVLGDLTGSMNAATRSEGKISVSPMSLYLSPPLPLLLLTYC